MSEYSRELYFVKGDRKYYYSNDILEKVSEILEKKILEDDNAFFSFMATYNFPEYCVKFYDNKIIFAISQNMTPHDEDIFKRCFDDIVKDSLLEALSYEYFK